MLDVNKDCVVIAKGSRADTNLLRVRVKRKGKPWQNTKPAFAGQKRPCTCQHQATYTRGSQELHRNVGGRWTASGAKNMGRRWQAHSDNDNDNKIYLIALDESAVLHAPDVQMSGERSAYQVVA